MGETYERARQGPVPPGDGGGSPPLEALRRIGVFRAVYYALTSGKDVRELLCDCVPGQLNLAIPPGSGLKPSASGSEAPYRVVV